MEMSILWAKIYMSLLSILQFRKKISVICTIILTCIIVVIIMLICLYGGDEEAIYKYYENGGNYKEMRKRLLDQSVKIDLKHLIDTDGYSEWMNKKGYNYVVQ